MKDLYSHALDAHAFIYNLLQIKKKNCVNPKSDGDYFTCIFYTQSVQDLSPLKHMSRHRSLSIVLFIKVKQYFIPQGMIYR